MKYRVFLTFEVKNISSNQKEAFYNYLKDFHWVKIDDLTTAWKTDFPSDVDRYFLVEYVDRYIKSATNYSNINNYRVSFEFEENSVALFKMYDNLWDTRSAP